MKSHTPVHHLHLHHRHQHHLYHTTTATWFLGSLPSPQPLVMSAVVVMVMMMVVVVMPASGHNGELCVVESPLHTPYVRSQRVTPTQCPGCLYPPMPHPPATPPHTDPFTQVHIIEVEGGVVGPVEVVVVDGGVVGRGRVVVVLSADPREHPGPSGVIFRVRPPGRPPVASNDTKYLFVVNKEAKMEVFSLKYSIVHQPSTMPSTSDLISTTRQRFGFVTSYTSVTSASEVTLRLPDANIRSGGDFCNDGGDDVVAVEQRSPVVECKVVEELPVAGCYHYDMLGRGDRDIHIIDVERSNNSLVVELVGGGDGGGVVVRNVTLVLRASHPTTWFLHAGQLQGTVTLLVGGGDQVENTSVPGVPGVTLQVRRMALPPTFDQLIVTVLTSIGPPVSYTRSDSTSRIILTVAPKTDNHIAYPPYLPDYKTPTVYAEEPASVIRAGLSVACDASSMTLALPYATAERVGGVAMALLDRACVGSRNGTHIVLRTEFTRCKFTKVLPSTTEGGEGGGGGGGRVVYSNLLSIELGPPLSDDEDLAGSGYGSDDEYFPPAIPSLKVTCEGEEVSSPSMPPSPPKHPRLPVPPPPHHHNHHRKPPSSSSSVGVRGVSYTLTLYSDRSLAHPITTTPDNTATATPVALHTRLYVQAALASVLPWADTTTTSTANLRVVLEECWMSNSTTSANASPPHTTITTTTTTTTLPLLRKSCRLHQSVTVEPLYAHSHAPTFSFQVLPEYTGMGAFYLHCQLGVCSPDTLPQPSVIRCIEPALYCSNPALLKVFDDQAASSSLQTLTLGPLTTASTTKSALFGGITRTTTTSQGVNHNHHAIGITRAAVGSGRGTKAEAEKEQVEDEEEEEEEGGEKTQIVVLGGLSTEIVVGIALASFVIGVCLTATLWVIHMKTDPRRQKRPDSSAPRNSGYDLSAHSGSSTPSSQAPMTA